MRAPISANIAVLDDDCFAHTLIAVVENVADIHGVAVPNRDRRLEIFELRVPHATERIRAKLEIRGSFASGLF